MTTIAERVRTIRDGLAAGCTPDEIYCDVEVLASVIEPLGVTPTLTPTTLFGYPVRIDLEADMAYIPIRALPPGEGVEWTDTSHKSDGVLADYDEDGRLVGIEVFLIKGRMRWESADEVRRLITNQKPNGASS